MAGEVMLINPRHKRRRKKSHRRRKRTRRHHAAMNPRPRRRRGHRRVARRHSRRRHHSNPRMPSFFGINVGQAAMVTGGYFVNNVLSNQLAKMLPADWAKDANAANMLRLGTKAVVTIGGTMLLKRTPAKGFANAFALGGAISILIDAVKTFAPAEWGLSDYQEGALSDYQPGLLSGYGHNLDVLSGEGAYGNAAY